MSNKKTVAKRKPSATQKRGVESKTKYFIGGDWSTLEEVMDEGINISDDWSDSIEDAYEVAVANNMDEEDMVLYTLEIKEAGKLKIKKEFSIN